HRAQVSVLDLQHHRTFRPPINVHGETGEPGDPRFLQILDITGVVDVAVAVHVAPANGDGGGMQQTVGKGCHGVPLGWDLAVYFAPFVSRPTAWGRGATHTTFLEEVSQCPHWPSTCQ